MNSSFSWAALRLHDRITGRHILARLDELNRTQWLSRDELLALQRDKLLRLLEIAYHNVPYYRRTFDQVGFSPLDFRKDPDNFYKIPPLTKEFVVDHVDEFMTTDPVVRKTMHSHSTSGSTGVPLIFWEDNNCRDSTTAEILRHLTWSGWHLFEPHIYLWGQSVNSSLRHRFRTNLMDLSLNRFVANAYILTDEQLFAFVKQIRRRKPVLLFGYASAIYAFAQFVQAKEMDDIKFRAIFSGGEVLYPYHRRFLEETFGGRVFDHYGALEIGGIASECDAHAGMHINVENCYVEIDRENNSSIDNQSGEIIITSLNNYCFPLIRYRLRDVIKTRLQGCPCGRQSPMIDSVHGRVVDIFRTSKGEAFWGDFALFETPGIRQYQVIQNTVNLISIRIVRDALLQESSIRNIEISIKKMMGNDMQIRFDFVDVLPRSNAGKYRYTFSELPEISASTPVVSE